MLTSLTLVSPHQDDAVFSLAECVRRLVTRGVRVRVVNCFTRSAYAPRRHPNDERPVIEIRAAEDRAVLAALGVTDVVDLGLLDAPLRLGAAARAFPVDRIAFYEELPYATRQPPHAFERVAAPLIPVALTTPDGGAAKERLAAMYASQIIAEELSTLDCGGRRGFAERLWVSPGGVDLRDLLTH